MEKLKISYPIIVEGKYDKIKLSSIVEGQIITTDGFGLFNSREKLSLIRTLADKSPIIVLTDSDGAGKVIRSHITSAVPKEKLIQLYIPQIAGKERRKEAPSAEGTLGVEGMECGLLRDILSPYAEGGEKAGGRGFSENRLSKTDFFIDGLSGCENSRERRDGLAARLGLPAGMTANALLAAVKLLCTYDEYLALVGRQNNNKQ